MELNFWDWNKALQRIIHCACNLISLFMIHNFSVGKLIHGEKWLLNMWNCSVSYDTHFTELEKNWKKHFCIPKVHLRYILNYCAHWALFQAYAWIVNDPVSIEQQWITLFNINNVCHSDGWKDSNATTLRSTRENLCVWVRCFSATSTC